MNSDNSSEEKPQWNEDGQEKAARGWYLNQNTYWIEVMARLAQQKRDFADLIRLLCAYTAAEIPLLLTERSNAG